MKKQKKLLQLAYDLAHELADGVHTYHQCDCGRAATRSGKCWMCLMDEMVKIYERVK